VTKADNMMVGQFAILSCDNTELLDGRKSCWFVLQSRKTSGWIVFTPCG